MSYNGIGLSTARGSGTSGFIQSNSASRGVYRSGKYEHRREEEEKARYNESKLRLTSVSDRNIDSDLVEHEKKRKIEVKVLELQVELEDQGLPEDEIDERTSELRLKLQAEEKRKSSRYAPSQNSRYTKQERSENVSKNIHVESTRKAQMNEYWESGSHNIRSKGHDDRDSRDYRRADHRNRRFDARDRRPNTRYEAQDRSHARKGPENRTWERERSPEISQSRSRSPSYREPRRMRSNSPRRGRESSKEFARRRLSASRDTSEHDGDFDIKRSDQSQRQSKRQTTNFARRGNSSGQRDHYAREEPPADSRRDSRPLRPYE